MAMTYGGMLYFPLKVNTFEEIAIELVEARFGLKGTAAVMKLLCKIYKDNGYYLKWDGEQCTLFANKVGKDINEEEMQGIVSILTEKGFFDLKAYREKQVLTSVEIQKGTAKGDISSPYWQRREEKHNVNIMSGN